MDLTPLAAFLAEHGRRLLEAQRLRRSLDEVFVRVTGVEAGLLRLEKGGRRD